MKRDPDISLFHNVLMTVGPGTAFLVLTVILAGIYLAIGGAEQLQHLLTIPQP